MTNTEHEIKEMELFAVKELFYSLYVKHINSNPKEARLFYGWYLTFTD